jgi:hypothetical protein
MSKQIRLEWQDEANNETAFKVYRGSSLSMNEGNSDLIVSIEWDGTSWNAGIVDTTNISGLTDFTSGGEPTDTEGTFGFTFTEASSGTYYYGVSAGNAVADSDVVPSTSAITI